MRRALGPEPTREIGDHIFGLPPFVWETAVFFGAFGAQILYYREHLEFQRVSVG